MTLSAIPGGEGEPEEPDWPSIYSDEFDVAYAHELWGIYVRDLQDRQSLTVANGSLIKVLIELSVQYERASRHVAEHGAILPAKRAKVGQFNPYWSVMTKAAREMQILHRTLCTSPDARNKAGKVQRAKKAARPADAFLRPVSK